VLDINKTLKILQTYNINSTKYEPTIYKNENNLGICLEIKDNIFGFLTRAFIFNTESELEDFLNKYFWYKNNKNKYNIEISLDTYTSPTPNIIYKYNDEILEHKEMINIESILEDENEEQKNIHLKNIYIINIKNLINYLNSLKKQKVNNKIEKNKLKTEENDLKHELIELLSLYYGKNKQIEKKQITLENIKNDNDKEDNIDFENKTLEEVEVYLKELIEEIKQEELDEKNLVTMYSNIVYKFNIEILKKQIDFVKNKIESEKNFNVKGTKLHNIDAELKSFLKTNLAPIKIDVFLLDNKEAIDKKFKQIEDLKYAYQIISGNTIEIPEFKEKKVFKQIDILEDLRMQYDLLEENQKAMLMLYNSFYKNICNYIIDNNYPRKEDIIKNCNIDYLYNEIEELVFNENNIHYLNKYFKYISFKSIDSYIESIINICHTIEEVKMQLGKNLKAFYIEENSKYKALTIDPILNNKEKVFLIEIEKNNNIIYIPDKIEIDELNKEFNTINTKNIFIKGEILESFETIEINNYTKKQIIENKITITKDLIIKNKIIFNLGTITGDKNE